MWAVGKGAVVWPLECIVCMLKIKWRNTELWNVCVEMEYFRSRELFLFLFWQMLSSWAWEQHLSNLQGGAVSQSLVFMTEACGVSFTENIHAHVHAHEIYRCTCREKWMCVYDWHLLTLPLLSCVQPHLLMQTCFRNGQTELLPPSLVELVTKPKHFISSFS